MLRVPVLENRKRIKPMVAQSHCIGDPLVFSDMIFRFFLVGLVRAILILYGSAFLVLSKPIFLRCSLCVSFGGFHRVLLTSHLLHHLPLHLVHLHSLSFTAAIVELRSAPRQLQIMLVTADLVSLSDPGRPMKADQLPTICATAMLSK